MKKSLSRILKLVSLILAIAGGLVFYNANEKKKEGFSIAFYNVENLMDTLDDTHSDDNDFLPNGKLKWNTKRYSQKVENLGSVINELGDADGPEILGLCEVENDRVVLDLIHSAHLKGKNYHYIHKESNDKRGIDVALIYKANSFKPFYSHSYEVYYGDNKFTSTRSILLVGGMIGSDSVYLFVNHWPSRRYGQEESEHKRMAAALKLRSVYDSIIQVHPQAKIVMMGDFNDEPSNASIKVLLKKNSDKIYMVNPFSELKNEGEGTVRFKSKWEMFDQILISQTFNNDKKHTYINKSAAVYHPLWMHYKEEYKNGPYRSFSGAKYHGGYSDHFPVYINIKDR